MPKFPPLVRRVPLTTALIVLVAVLSVVSGGLWDPLAGRPAGAWVSFGLPAVTDGSWWTVFPATFFALGPWGYLPVLFGLALIGGFAEWRLGTRQTAIALVSTYLAGIASALVLVWATSNHGYAWTTTLSHQREAGLSAAFLGAAAAASVTLSPPWRGRLRALLVGCVALLTIHVGTLGDLERTLAVAAGLLLGPYLAGRAPRMRVRSLTRRDFRLLACCFFVLAALEGLLQPFASPEGPLASTLSEQARLEDLHDRALLSSVLQAALWFWLARSLYKGRRRAWWWAVLLLGLVMAIQLVGLVMMIIDGQPGLPAALYELLGNGAGLTVLYVGRRAFRNPSPRRARRTAGSLLAPAGQEQQDNATAVLQQEGTANRLAWMTTWPENRWFETPDHRGYVAYRLHAGVALGVCDPVARTARDRAELLRAFADAARAAGLVPCLFSVTAECAGDATTQGWHSLQVAEEAVVDLPSLAFTGKAWQDVRTALNQAAKQGLGMRLGPLAEQPRGLQMQVKAISAEWVEDKGLPEMGFTLGGVDEALDPHVRTALAVDADGTVHGVTSWMPVYDVGGTPIGWTLDVMRRLPGGFRYSMEFLIASAAKAFRDEGCEVLSLSGAPLARSGVSTQTLDRGTLDEFLDRLGGALEPYYGFRSLHSFKTKFQPRLEPLFLIFPDQADLPRLGVALSRAYLPGAGVRDYVALARSGRGG